MKANMKTTAWLIATLFIAVMALADPSATPLPLRILYVGNLEKSRVKDFESFLKKHFVHVSVGNRVKAKRNSRPPDPRSASVMGGPNRWSFWAVPDSTWPRCGISRAAQAERAWRHSRTGYASTKSSLVRFGLTAQKPFANPRPSRGKPS